MGLRALLMLIFSIGGLAMVIYGWTLTSKMSGLIIMIVGVIFILTALLLYNKPFEDPKKYNKGDHNERK